MTNLILLGTGSVCLLMTVLWLLHLRLRNASVVDPGWAGGLALLGALYALLGTGWSTRRLIMAALAVIWGLRLSLYLLFTRVIGHPEEGRYVQLRREWRTNIPAKFLLFFQFQALLCVILATPFLQSAMNPTPGLVWTEYAAIALWLIAMVGETLADAQLNTFKANPANRGTTCRAGLWRYSRHPNYFFEWLIWVAFALFAWNAEYGYISIACPLLMLYFLFRVTGIPATEAQALRTKGDDYRRYQQTTSAFVPWFPRS